MDAKLRKSVVLIFLLIFTNALTLGLTRVHGQSAGENLAQLLSILFSNPSSIAVFIIEFFLGTGLGYGFQSLEYLISLAIIIFLGTLLSVWIAPSVNVNWALIIQGMIGFAYSLGFLTMLPVTLGLMIGAAIAIIH